MSARRHAQKILVAATAAAALCLGIIPAQAATSSPAQAATSASTLPAGVTRECPPTTVTSSAMTCMALVNGVASASPAGYGPASLQQAYNLVSAAKAQGNGQTVTLVEAYDDPTAASDLAHYRKQYGLTPCSSATGLGSGPGCLTQVNGNPASPLPEPNAAWAVQTSMDMDAVTAICPQCHILLVEATDASETNLMSAMRWAVATQGARFISLGFGVPDTSSLDQYSLNHDYLWQAYYDGLAITAAAGDGGQGVQWPASSPFVTAVGGTTLTPSSDSRGWAETAWSGTGAGCTTDYQPSWQQPMTKSPTCANRIQNDVSAVADPQTGVAFYDSYTFGGSGSHWGEGGGTNVSAAIVAAVYALAGTPRPDTFAPMYPYLHPGLLNDVTTGSDGTCGNYLCRAQTGYDGPTGLGTPDGTGAFTLPSSPVIALMPMEQVAGGDGPEVLVSDSADEVPLKITATGLPPGETLSLSSGCTNGGAPCIATLTGVPQAYGPYPVKLTAKDASAATGSLTFSVFAREQVTATAPATAAGTLSVPITPVAVSATDSEPGQSVTWTGSDLPAGLTVSSVNPPSLTGRIVGTPGATGIFNSVISATDTNGRQGFASIRWTIPSVITVANPGPQASTDGAPVLFPLNIRDSSPQSCCVAQVTASGLPPGLSLRGIYTNQMKRAYVITGWPTRRGTYDVTVSATDATHTPTVSTSFTWTVKGARDRGPTGHVRVRSGGKCLNDVGNRSRNGTPADIWTCNRSSAQRWTFAQDATVRIHGKCLTAPTHAGWKVRLETCRGRARQVWRLVNPRQVNGSAARSPLTLENPHTRLCLEDPHYSRHNGTRVVAGRCNGRTDEAWTVPAGQIQSQIAGKCGADNRDRSRDKTLIVLEGCANVAAQRWTAKPDGTVRIHGRCLTIAHGARTPGATIWLYSCFGGKNQQWRVTAGGHLVNPVSGLCLGTAGPLDSLTVTDGTRLVTQTCGNEIRETWHIR